MNDKILNFCDKNFNIEVLKAKKPVLVDFWAEWCSPCKMIIPILYEIANCNNYADKLIIGKLNVNDNPITAAKYIIRSIPTLALFKNEQLINNHIGFLSKTQLIKFLDENI
ncbi:MAG: thioredoxin TrxA [Arsenophonus endosymbiont of Ceratovacuna japonica]